MVQFNDLQSQVLKNIYNYLDDDSKDNFRCTNEKLYKSFDSKKLANVEKFNRNGQNLNKLPKELVYMKNISNLILDNNELSSIPDEISNLDKLRFLSMRWNNISTISPEIGKLKNLTRLSLRENGISSLPEEIGDLSSLTHIFLQSNEIKVIPKSIGRLKLLHILDLDNNLIESIPKSINRCKYLHTINLEKNRISVLPKELFDLKNLYILNLNSNEIVNIPKEIENASSLQLLSLNDNIISTLPSELFNLQNLKSLYVKSNRLSEIPKEIPNAIKLKILFLNSNDIQEIPVELMDATSLTELNLSENEIEVVPNNINLLSKLTYLDLSFNKISEVPVEISDLSNLETLNLNDNLITEIPFEVKNGKLNKLRNFNVRNNNIANPDEICIYAGTELETNTESEMPVSFNAIYNNVRPLNKGLTIQSRHSKRDSLGHQMYADLISESGTSDIASVDDTVQESERLKMLKEKLSILTNNYNSLDENVKMKNEAFLNELLKDTDLLSTKNKETVDDLINKFITDVQPEIDEIIQQNKFIKEELKNGNESIKSLEARKEEAMNKINNLKDRLRVEITMIKEKNRKEEKKSKYDNDLIKNNFDPNMEFTFYPEELSQLIFGNYGTKTENSMPRMFVLLPKAVSGLKKVFSFKKGKDKTKEPNFWANVDNWSESPQFQFHYLCEFDGQEHIVETPYPYTVRNPNKIMATTAAIFKFSADCVLDRLDENANYCKSLFEKSLNTTAPNKYFENISSVSASKICSAKQDPVNYKQICHMIDSARYELKKIINEVDSSHKYGGLNKVTITKGCTRYMCKEHEEKFKKDGFGTKSTKNKVKSSRNSLSRSSRSPKSPRSSKTPKSPKLSSEPTSPKSPKTPKTPKCSKEDESKSPKSPKVSKSSKAEDEPKSPKSPKSSKSPRPSKSK